MKIVSFYHRDTGVIHPNQIMVSDDGAVALNTPPDHLPIDGHYDYQSQRVDIATGELIDYQPPAPSADHEWNAETKRWQLNIAAQSKVDNHYAAMAGIARLEAAQHRAVREFALGLPGAADRLTAINTEIAALRAQLQ